MSQAEAARISAEAALAHNSAMQEGEVRSAQQALQAATKELSHCQARLADLEATNTLLIQEQQVCLLLMDLELTWPSLNNNNNNSAFQLMMS